MSNIEFHISYRSSKPHFLSLELKIAFKYPRNRFRLPFIYLCLYLNVFYIGKKYNSRWAYMVRYIIFLGSLPLYYKLHVAVQFSLLSYYTNIFLYITVQHCYGNFQSLLSFLNLSLKKIIALFYNVLQISTTTF